jgi:ribose transport system permease protein
VQVCDVDVHQIERPVVTEDDGVDASHRTSRLRRRSLGDYALPGLLIVLIVTFSLWEPSTFATVANFKTILSANSVVALLALGAMMPLVVGEFDLSVGSNLGLSLIVCTGLLSKSHANLAVAIAAAIVCSTLVGLINGLLVARAGIDAFVTTLAISTLITGGVNWYSNGSTFSTNIPKTLTDIGQSSLWGIPYPVIFMAVAVIVAYYTMNATPLGRYLYSVGGNKDASRLSGLNVPRLTVLAFVASGFMAGVAGVVEAGQLGSGNPTVGPSYLLPAFAAVFLGATSFRRGAFNVAGTIVAVFTIAVGVNGLVAVGAPFYIEPIFTGAALLAAALAARALQRSRTSA